MKIRRDTQKEQMIKNAVKFWLTVKEDQTKNRKIRYWFLIKDLADIVKVAMGVAKRPCQVLKLQYLMIYMQQ